MSDKFRFGNGTCPSIEVDPFRPICRKPGIDPSEALSLEVPVPIFAPVVPPQECVCFTFAKGEAETVVKTHKVTAKSPLPKSKVAVEIAPSSDDCCSGGYTITPHIEIYIPELPIPDIVVPEVCLANSEVKVKVTYPDPDAQGGTNTVTSTGGTVTGGNAGKCLKYTFGELEIDLSGMKTGAFRNGGDVDKIDGRLWIDGTVNPDIAAYYGGGYGDWRTTHTDRDYDEVFRRGPLMRFALGDTDPSTVTKDQANGGPVAYPVPTAEVDTFFAAKNSESNGGSWGQAPNWTSGRTTLGTGGAADTWTSLGNLDIVWPTGVQWHTDGLSLALPMTEFLFNDSGVLSEAQETKLAALVSPGPATTKEYSRSSGGVTKSLHAGKNASGLVSRRDASSGSTEPDRITDGLQVNAGDGLRIYGLGDGDVAADDAGGGYHNDAAYDESRQGVLEIMYGPGFLIKDVDDGNGNPQYRNYPVDLPGALVPNDGRGLRVHGVTKKTNQWSEDQGSSDPGEESYPTSGANPNTYINELEVHVFDRDLTFQKDERLVLNDLERTDFPVVEAPRMFEGSDWWWEDRIGAAYRGGRAYQDIRFHEYYDKPDSDSAKAVLDNREYTVPILVPLLRMPLPSANASDRTAGTYMRGYDMSGNFYSDVYRPVLLSTGSTQGDATTQLAKQINDVRQVLDSLVVMFLHVSRSGLVLGVDPRESSKSINAAYPSASWSIPRFADK